MPTTQKRNTYSTTLKIDPMKSILLSLFVISSSLLLAQPANDECAGATSLGTLPTPGACISGLQNGAPVTLNNQSTVGATAASPYIYQTGCQGGGNMTTFALDTWYSFTATGTTANINVSGFPNANVALYAGTCGNLLGRGCTILPNGGSGTLVVTQIQPGETYYIQISGNSTSATDNSFTIAVDNDIDCNDCLLNASLTANPAPVNGGYQPGQQVQFCYTIDGWSQQNTNWLHGVQITMSNGWTGTVSNPVPAQTEQNIAGPGFDGAWYWFNNGIGNVNGTNWGPGFYFETVQNGTAPGNNFGDDCNGTNCTWTFCFTLTVNNNCTPGTPLTVTVNTSGDGESGSWGSSACTDDASTIFNAVQICCAAPTMSSTPQSCIGVNDGTVTATPGLGAAPWDYVWTNSAGTVVSSTNNVNGPNTVSNLAPGVYDVTVTDNNNCVSTNTVIIQPGINCQCLITNFTTNIGTCQTDNTFPVTGTVTFTNAPTTGTLVVEVVTATGTYTQTFNPPFVNGQVYSYNITNAISDGSASTVTAYFTADPACDQILNFTAPNACGCAAEIGTFTASITGSSNTNYVLCFGDEIEIVANGDYTPPGEATNPPNAGGYEPGITWLVYTCPPSVALTPSLTEDVPDDPCLLGLFSDFDLNDVNDMSWINGFPAGTFTNNTVYFVPITMYNLTDGLYSYVNTDLPCYELGTPFAVQYLPQITSTQSQTCTNVTATISGGLPAVNGSQFTAVAGSLTPANATFVNTTASNGGTIAITGLTAGQGYSFQVQDANGCPITVTGTFTGGPTLSYPQTAYCPVGTASPTITGTAGGTYTSTAGLSINASTGVINLGTSTPGTYTVTYTTPAVPGPACPATFTITVHPLPVIVANNVTVCQGGTVNVTASGANTYSWSPGTFLSATTGSSVTFSNGATTTYTVTGTDANGCINTDPVTVTVNGNAPINAGPDVAICIGASTTITATGGDTYNWDNGLGAGASHTVSPTTTTTYTVNGTDVNGCLGTDAVTITVNPLPVVNAGTDQTVCAGTSVTLSATGAATYSWDNGITQGVAFTPTATTTYTVTGTSAAGCINTDQVVVTVNPLPIVNAGPDQTVCIGSSVTLTATGAATYSWNNGVNQGVAFTPAATTTYTVTGTDANGCINTDQVLVTVNPLPVVNAGLDQAICIGASATLTATGATTYTWDNGITQGVAFTPAATATYSVTGTDANGCVNTDQVIITVNPLPTVNAGPDQAICVGTSTTLTASGATTYSWNNGVTQGAAFTPAATSTYTVTGTDANGCINTDQVTVTVNPLPVVNAGADQTICIGAPVILTATGASTYSWNNGVNQGVAFNPTSTATYTVTGTDANGCINTDQVLVTVNPLPIVNAGPDQTVCAGTAVTLTATGAATYTWDNGVTQGVAFTPAVGSVTYSVTGTSAAGCINTDQVIVSVNPNPTPVIQGPTEYCTGNFATLSTSQVYTGYNWSNGATTATINATQANNPITVTVTNSFGCTGVSPAYTVSENNVITANFTETICQGQSVLIHGVLQSVAGTYSQTYTSATGCDSIANVTLVVNPLPNVNAGPDQTVCTPTTTTLTATGASTYSWNNGITQGTPFTQPVGAVTYTVTGTDVNGCINTDQVQITVNPLPTVNAGPDQAICIGANATLTGSGASTYTWNNGVTNGVAFTPAATTTYTVTGTDANGCINTDQVIVTVNPLPLVNAGLDQTICIGASVTLSGSGAVNYSWNNGVTNGVAFTPASTTTYTVTGTNANGCINTDQVTVTVNPLPIVNAGPDVAVCLGQSVTLSGSGAATYSWSGGIQNGVAFTPAATTTYTVTGTSAAGCINTDQVTVTVNPLPNISAGPDTEACIGETVTLSGIGGVNYTWNLGVTDGVAFVPPGSTVYTVTGTDANGCINTDQISVTVNPLPVINAGPDQTVCVGTSVTLTASGGVAYSWDNGVSNGVPFTPAVGTITYTVTGTDLEGCENTDQVIVTVNPLPIVNAGSDQTVCAGSTVTLSGSGASTYTWSGGITNGTPFTPGVGTTSYTVTGTDANGCVNTDAVNINVNPLPLVSAGSDVTICEGESVTLSGSNGNTFSWSGGVVNGAPFTPSAGTYNYTVTGTDANGCVNTDQVIVVVNPIPNVFAGNDVAVCDGDNVTLTGSGAATYSWTGNINNGVAFVPSLGATTYTVTGTSAAGCINTDQVNVVVNPIPAVAFTPGATTGCAPFTTTLTNTTSGVSNCVWTISNGTTITGCGTVPVTFNQAGCFDVTLTTTSDEGCSSSMTANDLICVEAPPIASFEPSENQLSNLNTAVDFTNTTIGANSYVWDFGDGSLTNTDVNPSHVYPTDPVGNYNVMLIAYSPLGCTDTAYSLIQIYEELIFYVPNTFTPDNDTYNPIFKPVFTSGFDPFDYTLLIFNRWGEIIFESHNAEVGWDGSYGSNGEIEMCQDGTYTWKIEFKVTRWDERRQVVGHVNLIR